VWQYVAREPALAPRVLEPLPYLLAEVAYAVDHELACTLADVLVRRTHLAFETRDNGRAAARRIAPVMQARLGWSEATLAAQLAAYDDDAARLFSIDDR
jgi:glycerol-3-phosphate dehydrogenase